MRLNGFCFLSTLVAVRPFSILNIETGNLGVGGGSSIYITGTDLGDPFNAPTVLIGNNPNPSPTICSTQSFTSTTTRIHCKIDHDTGALPALPAGRWGSEHEKKITLHVLVDGREAYCDNGKHIGGTGLGDCRLTFDVGGTPLITAVHTPLVSAGELLRVQAMSRERIDGWHASNASKYADSVSSSVEVRLRRNGAYAGCVLRDELGSAHYHPLSAVGSADSNRVGCRVQADALDAAGFWEVEMAAGGRGFALVEPSARRIDLAAGKLYDVETTPRIHSVTPHAISAAGGALLTIAGTGFGASAADLDVRAAGAACTVHALVDGEIICKLGDIPGAAGSADTAAAATALGPPYVGERGVGWHWWSYPADTDPAPDTSVLAVLRALASFPGTPAGGGEPLPDFALPTGGGGCLTAARCAGSRLSGWLIAPVTADYSFVLRADSEAQLSWSGNQSASATALLASTPASAGAWALGSGIDDDPRISSPQKLVAGERYWLELLCAATATECAVGMRVHVSSAPSELAFSTRLLAPRAEATGSCSAINPADCCRYFEASGGSCFPAVSGTLFADSLNQGGTMPSCASSEWLQAHLQSATAFAPCPFPADVGTPSLLGANASTREQLPLNEACSAIMDRARCCSAIDGRGAYHPRIGCRAPAPPALTRRFIF